MKTYLKMSLAAVLSMVAMQSMASPSVSVMYENNKALELEGVKTELSYRHKRLETSVGVLADKDRVHSYGISAGVPLKTFNNGLQFTPFVGVDRYRTGDNRVLQSHQTVASVGLGAKYPVFKSIYLDGRVKYAFGMTGSDDKVEDVVYNIGLTKRF